MVSAAVVFCTGSMAEAVMDMEKVAAVIKPADFDAVFVVCKFCTVVTISQGQAVFPSVVPAYSVIFFTR